MNEKDMVELFWGNEMEGYSRLTASKRDEAWRFMTNWLGKKFPVSYHRYYRCHVTEDGVEHIDYGSHTNFFQMRPIKNKTNKGENNNMKKMYNFVGMFNSFEALMRRGGFSDLVCRFYDSEGEAIYKVIVGMTALPNDVMLHMVDAEGMDEVMDIPNAIEEFGIEFRSLSTMMGEYGFDIIPFDQLDEDGGNCNGDCTNCFAAEMADTNQSKEPETEKKRTLSGKDLNRPSLDAKKEKAIKELQELADALESIDMLFKNSKNGLSLDELFKNPLFNPNLLH